MCPLFYNSLQKTVVESFVKAFDSLSARLSIFQANISMNSDIRTTNSTGEARRDSTRSDSGFELGFKSDRAQGRKQLQMGRILEPGQ